MKFQKVRALVLLFSTRFLGKILCTEVPPIVSAAAVIERNGKILFLDYTYIKGYGIPGGLVRSGETLEETTFREVKEETGLDVVTMEYFTSAASAFRGVATISVSFVVQANGNENASTEGKLVWLSPNEAVGKMAYQASEITLKKYIATHHK